MTYEKKIELLDIVFVALVIFSAVMSAIGRVNAFDAAMFLGFGWYFWRGILLSKKTNQEFIDLKKWAAERGYSGNSL
jgi:uncharacterized membrane protein YbjE (DUF340 family)